MSEILNKLYYRDDITDKLRIIIKRLSVFDNVKGHNVIFVTINDKVFGLGNNDCGLCGFGHIK